MFKHLHNWFCLCLKLFQLCNNCSFFFLLSMRVIMYVHHVWCAHNDWQGFYRGYFNRQRCFSRTISIILEHPPPRNGKARVWKGTITPSVICEEQPDPRIGDQTQTLLALSKDLINSNEMSGPYWLKPHCHSSAKPNRDKKNETSVLSDWTGLHIKKQQP